MGRIAGSGAVLDRVISDVLRAPFFRRKPPKTAGREEFGREFTREFMRRCGRVDKRDIVATATALTARSIADAHSTIRIATERGTYRDFIVSGGGANNPTLMAMLANELRLLVCRFVLPTNSACPRRRKKRRPLRCWLFRPGTGSRRIAFGDRSKAACDFGKDFLCVSGNPFAAAAAHARPGATVPTWSLIVLALLVPLLSCSSKPDPNTLVMIIESSPTNLDPRVGLDAQSERIDELLFDDLCTRDEHFNVQPGLAERWEIPDPLTYIFHLHHGVKFHDGRPLTSRDVKWTFDSLLQGKIRSTKAAAYRLSITSTPPTISPSCFI